MTTVLAFSSYYLMAYPHGPHCQSQCQTTPSFISFSLSLCSLCHFLASILADPSIPSIYSFCPLHLLHYVSTSFPHSSLPLSLGHGCGDLSEWLCWLIGRRSPYIWGLSAGLQSARATPLSSLTTQVAPFGLNELWRVPAMPACPTLRCYAQTHTHA